MIQLWALQANKLLTSRNAQILTHSEDMAGSVQENVTALRQEANSWKEQALAYQQECEALKQATLEEQSDFLELFARLAERCVNERESALKAVVSVFARYSLSEGFLHWSRLVANKQLKGSLQLVDVANSQLRGVIAKVSNEQLNVPRLQMELDAANRDRDELRATVERNMAYTQALISNLNFLKSALPAHVTQQLPELPTKNEAARSPAVGAASKAAVSLEDILQSSSGVHPSSRSTLGRSRARHQ